MDIQWIIPIIVLVVWVLNHLLRNRELDEPVRPRPGNAGPNRGATNDIDRFLQEIDRLRRRGPEERTEPPEPPVVRPVSRSRPVPQSTPRARPVVRVRESRPVEPVVEVVEAIPVLPVVPSLPPSPIYHAPQAERRAPVAAAAMNMLRSSQSLAAAIVLQEVLGPPKCKRR